MAGESVSRPSWLWLTVVSPDAQYTVCTLEDSAASCSFTDTCLPVAGTLLLLVGCIWSAAKPDIANLLPSRIIQGMGMAPTESVPLFTDIGGSLMC